MHIFNHVVFAACHPAPKGMYDGSLNPVSSTQFFRKTPCTSLETERASPHEATGTSRAPRRRRRLQQRCTARLLDSSLCGSRHPGRSRAREGAIAVVALRCSSASCDGWTLLTAAMVTAAVARSAPPEALIAAHGRRGGRYRGHDGGRQRQGVG